MDIFEYFEDVPTSQFIHPFSRDTLHYQSGTFLIPRNSINL
jgi:hypothetical protein